MEDAPKKYFRLKPDGEVRLKYTYIVKCVSFEKDAQGNVTVVHCEVDPSSKPGAGEWRSVKGTIHWVSQQYAKQIEARLFDTLFTEEQMGAIPEGVDYKQYLNPDSLVIKSAYAEPALLEDKSGIAVQFERVGYFYHDPKTGEAQRLRTGRPRCGRLPPQGRYPSFLFAARMNTMPRGVSTCRRRYTRLSAGSL